MNFGVSKALGVFSVIHNSW